jgi:hypothetical protein
MDGELIAREANNLTVLGRQLQKATYETLDDLLAVGMRIVAMRKVMPLVAVDMENEKEQIMSIAAFMAVRYAESINHASSVTVHTFAWGSYSAYGALVANLQSTTDVFVLRFNHDTPVPCTAFSLTRGPMSWRETRQNILSYIAHTDDAVSIVHLLQEAVTACRKWIDDFLFYINANRIPKMMSYAFTIPSVTGNEFTARVLDRGHNIVGIEETQVTALANVLLHLHRYVDYEETALAAVSGNLYRWLV